MVFNDYELVQTKRVTQTRYGQWIYCNRLFEAAGGFSTVFLMGSWSYAARMMGSQSNLAPLVQPYMSQAGMQSLARNGAFMAGPALVALALGVSAFGNSEELFKLVKSPRFYYNEFRAVQKELAGF